MNSPRAAADIAGAGAAASPVATSEPTDPDLVVNIDDDDQSLSRGRLAELDWRRGVAILGAYAASLVLFGIIVAIKGADPIGVYRALFHGSIVSSGAFDQVVLRAVPIVLAALAVAVPARAGLVNVGGEGQLIIGAIAATGVGVSIGGSSPGPVTWLLMGLGGRGGRRRVGGFGRPGPNQARRERSRDNAAHELRGQRHHAVPAVPAVERPQRRGTAAEPPTPDARTAPASCSAPN